MQRPWTCLRKGSAACRAGERKRTDIHKVQSSYQSQPAPNESSLCLVLIRGKFYLKTATHLHLFLGMFLWAGTAKQVPLCSLAAGRGPNPVPYFPNTTLGVIQLNFGASAAVAQRSPAGPCQAWQRQEPNQAAQHSDCSHGPLKKQTAVCTSEGKRLSRILFPLLDPQAHFCGVKSYFPVLRMLHFPLLLFERPTKTNGENNWLNRKQWNLQPTKCWETGQSKQFFWVIFNNLS